MNEKANVDKEIEQLKKTVSNKTESAADIAKDKYFQARDEARKFAEHLEENAYHYGAVARDMLENSQKAVEQSAQYIKDQAKSHPFLTAGLGFCLGMLIGRMSKD